MKYNNPIIFKTVPPYIEHSQHDLILRFNSKGYGRPQCIYVVQDTVRCRGHFYVSIEELLYAYDVPLVFYLELLRIKNENTI